MLPVFGRWRRPALWLSLALLAVNVAIVWPLFQVEYLAQTGTTEGIFVSYARYARDHWPDLGWCRFWYAGLPFQNAYPPGLHLTVALVSWLGRISAARAFHIVLAAVYALGPVTLFWMALRLTRSAIWSFAAGLLYSLISPSAFLARDIHNDLGSYFWDRRLHTPIAWGDSPHVCSLTLIPLAILALDFALKKRTATTFVVAAMALAAVPLTNWPGAIALALTALAYGLTMARGIRGWARIAAAGALGYAYAIPWMPPSTLLTTEADVQAIQAPNPFGVRHLIVLAAVAALSWVVLRLTRKAPEYLRFFLLSFLYIGAIPISYYWFKIILLAEPHRLHLAMEMAFVLSLVFAVRQLAGRWRVVRVPVAVAFGGLCVFQFVEYYGYARRLIRPIDIGRASEYKTAHWFDEHMRQDRVWPTGSEVFWLNAFTDTPQATGCCSQSVLTPMIEIANYAILTDAGAEEHAFENSLEWYKALGVRAVAVSGPRSTEPFRGFAHPHKFEGRLRELWRDGDDVIYEVPWRKYSLAHAIAPGDLVRRTYYGVDYEALVPYVAAIEGSSLDVRWTDNETMVISGEVGRGQILSAQENAHFGWHASVGGAARRVYADQLGFLVVEPDCAGLCTVVLHYDGGGEMRAAHWICGTALVGSLILLGLGPTWLLLAKR